MIFISLCALVELRWDERQCVAVARVHYTQNTIGIHQQSLWIIAKQWHFLLLLSLSLWFLLACPFFLLFFHRSTRNCIYIWLVTHEIHAAVRQSTNKNSIIIIQKSNDIFDRETIWLIECIKMNVELLPNLLVIKWDRSIEKFINHSDDLTSRQTNEESKERIR